MAGVNCSLNFEDVAGVAGSWKTVAAICAPTNQMVRIRRVKIAGEGTAGDGKPIGVRLTRITAASGTGTSATPQKLNNALGLTVQTTARVNFTVEPSESGTTPYAYVGKFHPQGGFVDDLPFDDLMLEVATELALQVKIPSAESAINMTGHVIFEE